MIKNKGDMGNIKKLDYMNRINWIRTRAKTKNYRQKK